MKQQTITFSFFTAFIAGLIFVLHGLSASVKAQPSSPERGFNPGKSYSMSEIENVASQSGNLMLNVPLGSLPPGRGGMSASVGLYYNSKIYDTFTMNNGDPSSATHKLTDSKTGGGWRYNYQYTLAADVLQGMNCSQEGDNNLSKLYIVLPDGSRHVLHLTGYTNSDGFMQMMPDGGISCEYANVPAPPAGSLNYYTIDGTYLRLEFDYDGDTADWTNNSWTLFLPDGSRVRRYAGIDPANHNFTVTQRIYDRNENYIEVVETAADSNYNNHKTTYLQDQMNRKVVIEYEADPVNYPNRDWIHSKGSGGATVTTKIDWRGTTARKTYNSCGSDNFNTMNCNSTSLNKTFRVVDKIHLPSQIGGNLSYEFEYNSDGAANPSNGWGEISQVKLPSGASSDYEYEGDGVHRMATEQVLRNRPNKKTLTYLSEYGGASSTVSEIWHYGVTYHQLDGHYNEPATTSITAPDGSVSTEYYVAQTLSLAQPAYAGEMWKSVRGNGTVIEKYYQTDAPRSGLPEANRYVKYEYTSITDAASNLVKTAIKEYSQDKNGNVTEIKEYDFVPYSSVPRDSSGRPTGLPSNAASYLKRLTKTDYYNDTPDAASTDYTDADSYHASSNPRLLRLVKSSEIQNAVGTPQTRSEISYDYTSYATNTKGGNPTETKTWDSTKQAILQAANGSGFRLDNYNSISSTAGYDAYGNPTLTIDGKGYQTQITYGSINGYSGLYPTQTVAAYGTAIARTSTAAYDFSTGLITTATDADNNVSTQTTYDDLGRPTKTAAAVGTPLEVWTQTVYDDANRRVITKADIETKGDARKIGVQFYDQLGRVRLTKTLEDASIQSATNETDGIKVQTRYKTVNGYTYQLTSNPYRAATSAGATNEATMGWTLSTASANGKHSEVETFAGAGLPTVFGGTNTDSTGVVRTDTDADRTLVTDQAGKQRISKTNALGQLTDIWEITASDSATTGVSFPNQTLAAGYRTSYGYDTLNNLTTVNQGSQTRSFSYSSLSRLKSATNPESGLIQYQYDANGNLSKKIDARNIRTIYDYDALNRLVKRCYRTTGTMTTCVNNNDTPEPNTRDVAYTYDNLPNAKGKLTKVITGDVNAPFSVTEYQAFDILGRVTQSRQTVDGVAYGTTAQIYKYNLSGVLIEQTYPSGRVVKNVLDTDGDLAMVQSKKNANAGYWNYAKAFTYTAAGAVSSMQLGNGGWESTVFNSRLQPTQIALGTTPNAANLLKLDYEYGKMVSGVLQPHSNNGNVAKQTISVPTVGAATGFTAVQYYEYDELNRLKQAAEQLTPNGAATITSWWQTYEYDRYGNRRFNEQYTTTLPKNCGAAPNHTVCPADVPIYNPTINAANNRLNGAAFDNAGNTIKDAQNRKFIYDGENKQTKVETVDASGQTTGTLGEYFYDGDGKRVKKIAGNEVTIFIYDALGKLVAEYANQIAAPTDAQVSYLTADHLGSPRINTDANGQVISRHDYQPFGEEIQRASYGGDEVRKQFTSYERDNESSLDYAQNRYHNYNHGRFTSPDPLAASASVGNPQSWNRYAYVLNNPTNLVDPLGLSAECPPGQNCFYNPSNQLVYLDGDGAETVVDESTPPAMGFFDPNAVPRTVVNPAAPAAATGGSTVLATVGRMLAFGVGALTTIALLPQTVQAPGLPARPDEEEDRDPGGVAIVSLYPKGHIMNGERLDHRHTFIQVIANTGETRTTHQVALTPTSTTIEDGSYLPTAPITTQIPLPNARGALQFQQSQLGTTLPAYNPVGNSCVHHVADVLRAGGVNIPPGNSRDINRSIRGLK